jgi:hypothetical protein
VILSGECCIMCLSSSFHFGWLLLLFKRNSMRERFSIRVRL